VVLFGGEGGKKSFFWERETKKDFFKYKKGVNLTKISKIMEIFTIIL
jgi:hypothetical protein